MFNSILIVCIGNICRSPMGEAIFRQRMEQLNLPVSVTSAGIEALAGYPAHEMAQALMRQKNLDISSHRARQITPEILLNSDLVLTMETEHREHIETMFPAIRGRVHRLGKWGEFDIPDPYMRPQAAFDYALTLIEQGVQEWQAKLWNT